MTRSQTSRGSMSLFASGGERKYLNRAECSRFIKAISVLPDPHDRTFCEMVFYTGCRPSEALALSAMNIDLDECMIIIKTLKQCGKYKGQRCRTVPVPRAFIRRLNKVHHIRKAQALPGSKSDRLWKISRTTAWKRIKTVMEAAGLIGKKASARGLRHAYGVNAALAKVPESCIQKWLGHAKAETSAIYLNTTGPEDRAIAKRMWLR